MDYSLICNRIKELRIHKCGQGHGAVKEFAEFLGMKYTTYINYEKDRVSPEILVLLKEKLGVSTDWLLTGKQEEERKEVQPETLKKVEELLGERMGRKEVGKETMNYIDKLLTILEDDSPETRGKVKGFIDALYNPELLTENQKKMA